MRLEITASVEIIKNKFNLDDRYNNCRERLNKHTIVLSDELFNLWKQHFKSEEYEKQLENWYFSIVGIKSRMKKVKIQDLDNILGASNNDDKIVAGTAAASEDKIVVGIDDSNIISNNRDITFISKNIFLQDKIQTITVSDITNVLSKARNDRLFDIYETPIRIRVQLNSDSALLSNYLSKFFKNSKKLIIKDKYINERENERNLNKYILNHINKDDCEITFIVYWDKHNKSQIERKFTNYAGYNTNVKSSSKEQGHNSFIETDKYIIDLGYRLKVFGDIDDGKTEEEIITITKK